MSYKFAIVGSRGYPSTYGGFETLVRRLAPYLREHGDDVTVYCRGASPRVDFRDGIRCVTTRGVASTSLSTLSSGASAALHARTEGYDAALILNCANGYFLPIFRSASVPTAVNVDGLEWERGKWGPVGKRAFKLGASLTGSFADLIIVDSLAIGDYWSETFRRSSVYIPYGADIEGRPCGRIHEMGLEEEKYILVVARLVPENNVWLFLDAVDLLPADVSVVVVGSEPTAGTLSQRLRRMASQRHTFRWLGHVNDQQLLKELWCHSGVYFHGHSVGGTNPALLQALGYGAPTVALDTVFNREVIASSEQMVQPDADVIASKLHMVLHDQATRFSFRDHGRRVINERYTWEGVLKAYRRELVHLATARSATTARTLELVP